MRMHANSNSEPEAPVLCKTRALEIPRELAACKALAFKQLEPRRHPRGFSHAFCIVGLPPGDLTIHKMFLTQCAACAAPLGLSLGKKCGSTRQHQVQKK